MTFPRFPNERWGTSGNLGNLTFPSRLGNLALGNVISVVKEQFNRRSPGSPRRSPSHLPSLPAAYKAGRVEGRGVDLGKVAADASADVTLGGQMRQARPDRGINGARKSHKRRTEEC
jgi:hypothetical protein